MKNGATLGPYRIDAELGSGGMGKVYRATTVRRAAGLETGVTVALKVVHAHLLETEGFFKRFLREAEIGKSVRHENVVRTIDVDAVVAGGAHHHFMVMEYVEGQTLRSLLKELDKVPEELCRHIGREAAKGLAAIHATGVVHRDMKPENVLITREHVVKVMDLGVARLNDEALRLSQTGAFVGSIHYAAPECFSDGGRNVDGRADLHALGLVLYELAGGTNPYLADDVPQILKKVLHEEPRRLGDINPQLSPFFEEVVHCLLAKKPEDRFADAAALLGVLEEGEDAAWWKARAKAIRAVTHRPMRRIRIPRETAVYGRDAELAKLRALFEKAKAGDGQVVVLEGEAGIGKSRVVDELIGRLQREGEDLDFLFGSYPPGGAATAAGAFSTAFREQFGDADLADALRERLGPAAILAPAFAALLLGSAAPTGAEPLTKDSLQTCFVAALRSLAAERTTVLLIDDLHFATEDARGLFTSIAMAVPGHRIVLVGTTRPGIDDKWLAGLTRLPQTSQMTLPRLGPKDLALLLKDSFKSEQLAQSLAMQVGLKSDGNPFFAFEIIRGLREGQFITQRDDGTWVSTRVIDDIKIPSSVLDLVNARVGDLSEDERNLLDVAACWGFEFAPGVIGTVLGLGPVPALQTFGKIEKKHRLIRSSGRNYVFDHHQVQEALYGALHEELREHYHAALADALEARAKCADRDPATLDGALCVDLCEHFLNGAQGERATRYLDAALAYLEKGYLNDAAIRLADRALAAPGLVTGRARCELLLRKASRLGLLGRRDAESAALAEALRLADEDGDAVLRSRARRALARHLYGVSRFDEAHTRCTEALDLARSAGDRKAEVGAVAVLGVVLWRLGRHAEAQSCHEQRLAFARESGDLGEQAAATINLGLALSAAGRFEDALLSTEQGLALARGAGHRLWESNATGNLGIEYFSLGRYSDALEPSGRHLALAREIGDRGGEARALSNIGELLGLLGRGTEAEERLDRALTLFREVGERRSEATALGSLGEVAARRGAEDEAERLYRDARARLASIGVRTDFAGVAHALGALFARTGRRDEARAAFEEALTVAEEQDLPAVRAGALADLALLGARDPADAVRALAECESRIGVDARMATRFILWKATRDGVHVAEAKRLLDHLVANAPADCRESMLANVPLYRDIAAAAKEAGL